MTDETAMADARSRLRITFNTEPTPFDEIARVVLHGKAGELLPDIVARIASVRTQE